MGQRVRPAEHAEIPQLRLWLVGSAWLAGFYRCLGIPVRFVDPDHGIHAEPFVPAYCLVSWKRGLTSPRVLTAMLLQAVDPHDYCSWRLLDSLQLIRRQASALV